VNGAKSDRLLEDLVMPAAAHRERKKEESRLFPAGLGIPLVSAGF
jgi:hypothetical protein